jgi:hypothetical protein
MKFLPLISILLLCTAMPFCDKIDSSINRGLEEEKGYSRHAMGYIVNTPNKRPGNRELEDWSTADYVAQAVASAKIPGVWARFSDQLEFLLPTIQRNSSGYPFCLIQQPDSLVVLSYLSQAPPTCTAESAQGIDTSRIQSGDLEFSGRADFWVYVLRP